MKVILFAILMSAVNVFATTTDVCVIGESKKATELLRQINGGGICFTPAEVVQFALQDSLVAHCSFRQDAKLIPYSQIEWVPAVPASCSPGKIGYRAKVNEVTPIDQARADIIAQLYLDGYILFDGNTLLRTR